MNFNVPKSIYAGGVVSTIAPQKMSVPKIEVLPEGPVSYSFSIVFDGQDATDYLTLADGNDIFGIGTVLDLSTLQKNQILSPIQNMQYEFDTGTLSEQANYTVPGDWIVLTDVGQLLQFSMGSYIFNGTSYVPSLPIYSGSVGILSRAPSSIVIFKEFDSFVSPSSTVFGSATLNFTNYSLPNWVQVAQGEATA